jgi:hypothetical protein
MIRGVCVAAAALTMAGGGAIAFASPASADVVSPPGACAGSGHWVKANLDETSAEHKPDDVIKVPRSDTVQWAGNIKGNQLGAVGPDRPISGSVQLDLPIGSVTVDSWGGSSDRYANKGEHSYDLPSVLSGIKIKLHGEHKDNGVVTCSGSVYVQVEGSAFSNPLTWGGLGGLVISGGALVFAGRPSFRKRWAFEDTNPG